MEGKGLSRSEIIALAGAVLMALGLFLDWYHLGSKNDSLNGIAGPASLTGWQAHHIIRFLLLAAAVAPLILAYIVARNRELSWPRGEMTAVVAITAAGLIFYVAIVSRPGSVRSLTSLSIGVFVSLAGALIMAAGSAIRASATERPRKPPGVL